MPASLQGCAMGTANDAPAPHGSAVLLAALLEIADDAIVVVDAEQRIVVFNRGAETAFGWPAAAALGQPLDALLPAAARATHRGQVAAFGRGAPTARRMSERTAVYARRRDGTEFPAEVSICHLDWQGQRHFAAILRDVSDRRRQEQALRQLHEELERRVEERTAELRQANARLEEQREELRTTSRQLWQSAKLASVGELAASIAHELNNPLATITLRLEQLLDKLPAGEPTRPALEIVAQESERMADLVANLLQFSRRGEDTASSMDLADELRRALDLVASMLRKLAVEIRDELPADLPTVYAHRQKFRQVFLNLLTNAADAMRGGGLLTLGARAVVLDGGAPAVEIRIADTGPGIPEEHLANVFEPFFTTKEEGKGTGLGLAICKRIVKEHGGRIALERGPAGGCVARIVVPVGDGANAAALRED